MSWPISVTLLIKSRPMIRRRAIESNWKISLRDLSQNEISTVDGKNKSKIREEKGEGF